MRISLEFHCKYRLNFAPNYVFTTNPKMLVNLKTNRIINQVMKGSTIGYVINGYFYSLDKLRKNLEIIPTKQFIPF
jgi:hypothetical protein